CDAGAASESRLAAQPDGLQPAEHFLDALAQSLAHPVPSVARGARVERRDLLLGHVRSHVERAETLDEVPVVVVLVRAERGSTAPGNLLGHGPGALPLPPPSALGEPPIPP